VREEALKENLREEMERKAGCCFGLAVR